MIYGIQTREIYRWNKEKDDEIRKATPLLKEFRYSGSLETDDDVDYFEYESGASENITLDFQHDNLTEDRTGWEIELLDENSETINLKDDSKLYSKWDKPVVESDGVKLEKGMTYYIRVSHGGSYTNETYHIRLR